MDDDLDGIFADLRPEDFTVRTSAFAERSGWYPPTTFDSFVDDAVFTTRLLFAADEGGMLVPITYLVGPTRMWVFKPTEEETLGDYLGRLTDEAYHLRAEWFFFARSTSVASTLVPADRHLLDPTSSEAVAHAAAEGALRDGVFWYAICRNGALRRRRSGIFLIEGDQLVRGVEQAEQTAEVFESVLDW